MKRRTFRTLQGMKALIPDRVWGEWYLVTDEEYEFFVNELLPKGLPQSASRPPLYTFNGYKLLKESHITIKQ